MPGYIRAALKTFQWIFSKPQHSPFPWNRPVFGQCIQYADLVSDSPPLHATDTTRVQSICGTFLYYGQAIDPTILPALNRISTSQSAPTEETLARCLQLLDYLATYPDATIQYTASDIILICETDAAYLVLPKARSHIAGHYFLTN